MLNLWLLYTDGAYRACRVRPRPLKEGEARNMKLQLQQRAESLMKYGEEMAEEMVVRNYIAKECCFPPSVTCELGRIGRTCTTQSLSGGK